ncbi:hypothetical protein Btru_057069 [Bulinus truncatus]|nr:hypothetical protein Btru_057069 [Bulinus truncatus]
MATATEPDYAVSEDKDGYVKIKAHIKGLKVEKKGGKQSKAKGKNADIEITFGSSNFELTVTPHSNDQKFNNINYSFIMKTLPHEIEPSSSYIEADNDWISLLLKKKDKSISWASDIRGGQLATTN